MGVDIETLDEDAISTDTMDNSMDIDISIQPLPLMRHTFLKAALRFFHIRFGM